MEAGVCCSVWGAAGVLQMSWGCCRRDGDCDQRMFCRLGSWGLGRCCRHAGGALGVLLLGCHRRVPLPTAGSGGDPLCNFPRKPGCTLRCGWEAALLSSPVSHLTAGLRQSGPLWCRGNEALEGYPILALLGQPFMATALTGDPQCLGVSA